MTTESPRYNCFTRNTGNAIPKHAGPEAKGSNPTAGLTPLRTRNPFRGNFNHWQVSLKEARQIFYFFNLVILLCCYGPWLPVTAGKLIYYINFFFNFLVK